MKRIVSAVLLAAMLLSLLGCSAGETQPASETTAETAVETTQAVQPETTAETTVETQPEKEEGFLFLSVSGITFSVIGESEDIYLGSIPREAITWESADESVATVSGGVITATGVGQTTVTCTYGEETMTCQVGCLAENEEALYALPLSTLRTPKRLPPVYDDVEVTFFDGSAVSGDSIAYGMFQWELRNDMLGDCLFLARGGASVNAFANHLRKVYYKGSEMDLEEAMAEAGVNKLFIMLGENDMRYMSIEDTMANWEILIDHVRTECPDVEIYIQSCVPEWTENPRYNSKNEKLMEYNVVLEEFCAENDIHFWDMWPYIVDHIDSMASEYALDMSIHLGEKGCYVWMQALRACAILEELNNNG